MGLRWLNLWCLLILLGLLTPGIITFWGKNSAGSKIELQTGL